MNQTLEFTGAFPIGDSDPQAMPVPNVDRAVAYYQEVMGFTLRDRADEPVRSATMTCGSVTLRFVENGADPEQASCYLSVRDVDQAYRELEARGAQLSPIRTDEHDGKSYRVFFLRDPDGLCYCIGAPA